jgi:hypothetical protein
MPPVIPPFNPVTSLFPNLTNPPIYPYGYPPEVPRAMPSNWPTSGNPQSNFIYPTPNPYRSIITIPNSLFYRG